MLHYVFFLFCRILYLQSLYKKYNKMAVRFKEPLCKKKEKKQKKQRKNLLIQRKKQLKQRNNEYR